MRHKRLKLTSVLLLGLALTGLQAQTSLNATGGNSFSSGGTVSYSVGQVLYQTYTGTNGSVAIGVQQPYEISVVTVVEETEGISLLISVFPNPTTDCFTLDVKEIDILNLHLQLYDMQGKLLQNKKITENQTNIVMSNCVPAAYFLKVIKGDREIKTFKIIKK